MIFHSMTTLMRAREALRRHGVMSRIIRTPSHLRGGSCGSSLLVRRDFDRAMEILKRHRIPVSGVSEVDFP